MHKFGLKHNKGIKIAKSGLNKEYTANNERLIKDIGSFDFTTIEEGIQKQIEWQMNI